MRNIFDQYGQPENRLTHALVTCLINDRRLLRKFIRWTTKSEPPAHLEVIEQCLPGEDETTNEEDAQRRGLPDAWIQDGKGWCLIVESKIESPLLRDQLDRHTMTASRRGFTDVHLLALVAKPSRASFSNQVTIVDWPVLYSWLSAARQSIWTRFLTEYMEILEADLAEKGYLKGGALTVFSGIPFGKDHPYNYREAKRLLGLSLDCLSKRSDLQKELGMDPEGKRRPAITGKDAPSVWDFLPLVQAQRRQRAADSPTENAGERPFTSCPHLTLSIQQDRVFASVTVPNGIRRRYLKNMLGDSEEEFLQLVADIRTNLAHCLRKAPGAVPWAQLVQRHYPSQRAPAIIDASLEFDLRTASPVSSRGHGPVRSQPEWMGTVYRVLENKREANLQLTVGAVFPYSSCEAVRDKEILEHVANVWLACQPLIGTILRQVIT